MALKSKICKHCKQSFTPERQFQTTCNYQCAMDYARNKAKTEQAKEKRKAVKKLKANLEKTTLGDISELAALKSEMESKDSSK